MNKTINKIFGYGHFIVGALKIILIIFVVTQFSSSINSILLEKETSGTSNLELIETINLWMGIVQWILLFGSIIMIFVNTNNEPETIPGYLIGIGAIATELLMPNFFSFFKLFTVAGIYMKAGSKINQAASKYTTVRKTTKKTIKSTNWFFNDDTRENSDKEIKKDISEKDLDNTNLKLEYKTSGKKIYKEEMEELISKKYIIGIGSIIVVLVIIICIIISRTAAKEDEKPVFKSEGTQIGITGESHIGDEQNITDIKNYNNVHEINTNTNMQDENIELNKIKNTFDNCNKIQSLKEKGFFIDTFVVDNKLKVNCNIYNFSFYLEFVKTGNILSTEILSDVDNPEYIPEKSFIELTLAAILIDCVGQVKGYPEGRIMEILGEDRALEFTINNEGVELKPIDGGRKISVKVDLNSNFPFLNSNG